MVFENRVDAGRRLASVLGDYRGSDALVLAVPRGGVVVGYEVAEILELPLDVVVPRKLGAPGEPELAIGAVSAWGDHDVILDHEAIRMLGVSQGYIERETEYQLAEIRRRLVEYRGRDEAPDVQNRSVIVVDDGIATGYTVQAAVKALRKLGPESVAVAVPVAAAEAVSTLEQMADAVYALTTPHPFLAVGHWYRGFGQTTDEEVVRLLRQRKEETNELPGR